MNVQVHNLVQTHVDTATARIVLRTQDGTDVGKLAIAVPRDQTGLFRATWAKEGLILEKVDDPRPRLAAADGKAANEPDPELLKTEYARLFGMSDEQLQNLAPELGVKWTAARNVSRETKVMALAKASLAASAAEPDAP